MRHEIKTALIWAGIYMATEIGIVLAGYSHDPNVHVIAFGVNSLCLLLAVAISIVSNFNKKKHEGISLVVDLKTGIKTSAIYALTIACFLLVYYKWIDPEYPEIRKKQWIEMTETAKFQEGVDQTIRNNPDMYYGKSSEDIRDNEQEGINMLLNPNKVFLISLLALLVLGMFYSFLVTAFNRLVLAKLG
ncbi:MAG: DUF4199 domain-containing protein [Flavobacteriales bacterium]|nr:DUF4199 domain-containing protein [Flavobacteriales bacterium]